MTTNRVSGLLVALFAVLLLAVIIPAETEAVDYGWVRPETLPQILGAILIPLGLLQAWHSIGQSEMKPGLTLRAAGFLALSVAAVWAMGRFGFIAVAPAMMLVLMLLLGERRWPWLAVGTAAVPAAIWGAVVLLLDRPLPG